jgi:molybdopterin-guanine dinucleotide biosynthesis protein A
MPSLSIQSIKQLLSAPPEKHLVCFDHYTLPFRIKVQSAYISLIESIFKEGKGYSLKNFQGKVGASILPLPPLKTSHFININTPDEWKKYTGEAL